MAYNYRELAHEEWAMNEEFQRPRLDSESCGEETDVGFDIGDTNTSKNDRTGNNFHGASHSVMSQANGAGRCMWKKVVKLLAPKKWLKRRRPRARCR